MATLEKMKICGIRCFGSQKDDEQSLRFGKPLTLILGPNGCGKSTIIESLRYVTAQKEPAGKGVFVHDPSLENTETVKGFVKLQLRDANGRPVHLSKTIQARKTPKGLSVKNLDSTISLEDPRTGEMNSISNKCADFTPEILRIFGVSKAILENVVFCTQEDSYWPLDTDQKLKEKFDQIFDSDKYNKCLKKVREHRKKIMEDCKRSNVELKHLKESKSAAAGKRTQLADLETEVAELNTQIETLNASLVPLEASLKDIHKKEVEVSRVYTVRETTKTELQGVEKLIKELERKIKSCEFTGSDDDLDRALKDCDQQLHDVTVLKAELAQVESKEKECMQRSKSLIGQIAQLKKLAELHVERELEMERKMRALASELGMDSTHLSVNGLERRIISKDKLVVEFQGQTVKDEESGQAELDKARECVFAQESVINQKKDALSANQKERNKLKKDMEDVDASQARVDRVAASLRKATDDLSDHLRIHNVDEIKGEITRWQNELRETEDELARVEDNVTKMQELTDVMKGLELQREVFANRSADIKRLKNRHGDAISELLGKVPDSGFKVLVESELETKKQMLREFQLQLSLKEKEVNTLEGRRRFLRETLQEKNKTLQTCHDQVLEETNGDDWEQSVVQMQKTVDDLQEAKGTLTSSSCMYQRYIRQLQRPKACCPLCARDFKADKEAMDLAEELERKIKDVPNRLSANRLELNKFQDKLNRLLALQSVQERIKSLKDVEIPDLEKELQQVELNLSSVRKDVDTIAVQKLQPEKAVEICNGLIGDMALLDQSIAECRSVQLDIEKLELRIPANTPVTGLRDAIAKQDKLRHSRKLARTHLDESHSRLQRYNEQFQTLQNRKHSLAEELRDLEGGAGSRSALEERYSDLQTLEGVLNGELEAAREALVPLKRVLAEAIAKLRQLKDSHSTKLDCRRKEIDQLRKPLDDIRRLEKESADFKSKGTEKTLDTLQADADSVDKEISSLRNKKESIGAKVGSCANNEVRRRELQDNKALRQRISERGVLTCKLQELEASFGGSAYDDLMKEKKRLKNEEEAIGQKKATIRGRVGALVGQINLVKQELASRLFKNADADHKKELIKFHVLDSVAKDLERYATCMENAMSVYHKQQMEKVNEFVHEYWRKIYKGNDVDYVEIQTDNVEASGSRRNYHYKLVMVKGEVRMDMRNRCSAGQKMLASLIIRIALAQVFSANCGILTLDEPTTNLDSKNVDSLAETLNEIVQDKQMVPNSNLQLIVITHDESFIKKLMDITGVPTYISVRRNKKGRTCVKRQEINDEGHDHFNGL